MSYDKAKWHFGAENYPEGLPIENGGTHIGFFLAWAIINGREGEMHREESEESLERVRKRTMTGRAFLLKECDGSFTDEDLSDEGNVFAEHYYQADGKRTTYLDDFAATLVTPDLPSDYHVADTWENYDRIAAVIDGRFAAWRQRRSAGERPSKRKGL